MALLGSATLRSVAAACLAGMWLCEEAKVVTGSKYASYVGITLFLVYFAVALAIARPAQRWVIVGVSGFAAVAALYYAVPSALVTGIESAVLFAAFLGAMQMLRVALDASPDMVALRSHFAGLPSDQQHDSLVLRTHLVSSVLGAGGLAVVAPLLDRERSDRQRREFAESALQGVGLAVLWSPFFVAMAVCTRLARDVTLRSAVLNGLIMAGIGLALSHFRYGGRLSLGPLRPLRRTLVEVAVLAAAIILANHFWGFGNLEAAVLGVPLVSACLARRELRMGVLRMGRRWFVSLGTIAVEALVVGAAMVLGDVIKELLAQGVIAIPHGAGAWPIPILIVIPPVLMLLTSLMGLHPIVSASCLLPLLASVHRLDSLVATGSVLLGWMLCVVLSGFVVPVMYAANLFAVQQHQLVRGRNLQFCAAFVPLAFVYLWALNLLLGAG